MKTSLYLIMLCACFASCSVRRPVPGSYYGNGAAYLKSIKLDKNGQFLISIDNNGRERAFLGNWKYQSKDTLILTYNLEDFPGVVAVNELNDKQEKVVLLNDNEIQFNQFVLSKNKHANATASVSRLP